ncbi:MAG: response regulator [Candidatus Fonsibacter sp.]
MKVLLVEDNKRLGPFIQQNLKKDNFITDIALNLEEADECLKNFKYDLMLLDLNLPDGDGIQFLKRIRDRKEYLPVLILTANALISSKIKGLEIGADDYVTKPFQHEELVARMRSILRRPQIQVSKIINVGNTDFNFETLEVKILNKPIKIAKREALILKTLVQKLSKLVTLNEIQDKNYAIDKDLSSNAIEVSIHRLRKILKKSNANLAIKNSRGIGYKLIII